jgi:death-on-curing protein
MNNRLKTLSAAEVLEIHAVLVAEFADTPDPISPPGVRSIALLESAVGRQHTSFGEVLKYPEEIANAATLLFGVCCDHPFYNGNKRTAMVAMLVHLDRNRLCIFDTTQRELYDFMLRVADHRVGMRKARKGRNKPMRRRNTDEEVEAIRKWLERRVSPLVRGERRITWRELRRILEIFGYYLADAHDNRIDIFRYETVESGLFLKKAKTIRKRVGTVGWPGDNRDIAISEIKSVRRLCRLREEDGVDSEVFYQNRGVIDAFVNRYRKLLRSLAKV